MWKRFVERAKYSRGWLTACQILLIFYSLFLIVLPFMAKSEPFEGNLWYTVGLFVFVFANVPLVSYLQTSLQIWEMYVQVRERHESESRLPTP